MTVDTEAMPTSLAELVEAQAEIARGITNEIERYVAYEGAKIAIERACDGDHYQRDLAVRAYLLLVKL